MLKNKWLLVIALVVFLILTQYVIFGISRLAWFDVSFSLETVQHMREKGFRSIDWPNYDVHAEGYYDILYFWSYVNPGMSVYHWAQELSVVAGLIFVIFAFLALQKVFGDAGGFAAASLVLFTTYAHFGTEARAYMIIMMLSAMIFWSVVNEFKGWSFGLSLVAVALLPFLNYLSVIALPFFAVMFIDMRMQRKFVRKDWLRLGLFVIIGSVAAAFVAIYYALPQKARFLAMWLPNSDITSWTDSLLFSFFMTERIVMPVVGLIIYILFSGLLMVLVWLTLKKLFGRVDYKDGLLIIMGLSSAFPMVALLLGRVLNLYHHRFFLVVTWLFAAMCLVLLWRMVLNGKKMIMWRFVLIAVVVVILMMWTAYATQQARELQRVEANTPCANITIVHESAFSMMPFQTYAREHECNWHNVISTDFDDVRMGYSAGFDAIPGKDIYWNLSYPDEGFYKVAAQERQYGNRTVTIVYEDDGVNLIFVAE